MNKNINLNLYKVFYYVALKKSFNDAAKELCVSQPAISKQIKNLEEILEVKLFYRYNKKIELTNEGKILLDQLEKVNFHLNISEKSINASKNLDSGQLVIGCQSHIASFYLLDYIEKFRKDYSGIMIKIISDSTSGLLNELRHHRVDFVIDNSPIKESTTNMIVEDLDVFETVLISSSEYNITNNFDSDSKNLILPLPRSSLLKNLEQTFKDHNIKFNAVLSVDTTDLIISSVKRNIGIGYVVKEAVKTELKNRELKEIKVGFNLPKFELKLIYNQEYLSFPALCFIKKYIKND